MHTLARPVLAALAAALALSGPARAQEYSNDWQATLDLVSAGAAASIVLHFRCAGSQAGNQSTAWAIDRVNAYVQHLATRAPLEEVRRYAFDATNLKLSALTQSSDGQSCYQLSRLRDIASGTGFALP